MNIIGENIRKYRDRMGFTQEHVASFLGVDQSYISKVEKGERTITADMLERLSSLYGVSVNTLEENGSQPSKLCFAFRGSELSTSDMNVISDINRIALNVEFMTCLLNGDLS